MTAITPIPAQGSTRLQHTYIDWSQSGTNPNNNMGPGQGIPWLQDRVNLSGNTVGRGGAWNNLSGVNKQNGEMMAFLGASSFNQGLFANYIIPCVGRNPNASRTLTPAENQQYWCWNFRLAQGGGIAQSGYSPVNPPYAPLGPITSDSGLFFFIQDFGRSSSSYQQFGDYPINGTNGGEAGFGFFLDELTGTWRYGVRYLFTGASHPLDVNVPLPAGQGVGQWPVPTPGGVADYSQFVNLKCEWFAPGATAQGSAARLLLSLDDVPFVNTTLADVGASPTGSGFGSQVPNAYDSSSLAFGWIGCIRGGPGNGSPTQLFPQCFNQIEYIGGPALSTTFAGS